MPKDAPVVNYNNYDSQYIRKNPPTTTYTRAFNNMNKEIYEKHINSINMSR